jgi:pre-mRNA-splicing factor RBM22/SLT11
MLDLTYGLPLAIRDAALQMAGDSALSGSNAIIKQYIAQNLEENNDLGGDMEARTKQAGHELLKRLSEGMRGRRQEYAEAATVKHEAPSKALMEDVQRIVSRLPLQGSISKLPKDDKIKSFFIMGVEDDVAEHSLRSYLSQYGPISALVCVHRARSAFVTFDSRETAETAAEALTKTAGKFAVDGCRLRAVWGKPRSLGTSGQEQLQVGQIIKKFLRNNSGGGDRRGVKATDGDPGEPVVVVPPPGSGVGQPEYKSQQNGYEA